LRIPTVSTMVSNHVRVLVGPGERQRQQDVLLRRQCRDQVVLLEDEAEAVTTQQREFGLVERRQFGVADERRPEVSRSRPATHCMRVLLPEPDGPMMAVNWCIGKSTVTPSNACTAVSPDPYVLTASTARAAGVVSSVVVMRAPMA
jgi:hypothetical protein